MNTRTANPNHYSLPAVTLKTALVHTVTYFVIGFLSYSLFNYSARYADPMLSNFMRQTDHPLVAFGPSLQVIRGFLFGLVIFWLQEAFIVRKNGWLYLWLTFLIVGILSPFGPSPGSIEGLLFTTVPLNFHLMGLPEVIIQSFLLAFITPYWVKNPEKKWLAWIIGILFGLAILFSILGGLVALGLFPSPAG